MKITLFKMRLKNSKKDCINKKIILEFLIPFEILNLASVLGRI